MHWHTDGPRGLLKYAFPPSEPYCTDTVQYQGKRRTAPTCGPLLGYGISSSLANSPEEGPSFSGEGHDLASAPICLDPSCLVPGRDQEELRDLSPVIVNTIIQARAPSMKRLYDLKWCIFMNWCSSRGKDPWRCGIESVLSKEAWITSTLKVYVATIVANHNTVGGKLVEKHDLVIRFIRGA